MKTKLTFVFALVAFGILSCSKPDTDDQTEQDVILKQKANPVAVPAGDPFNKQQVDQTVIGLLESRNDFHWHWVDIKTLWSAVQYGDQSLSIGYKPAYEGDISDKLHKIDVRSGDYKKVHDALIEMVLEELKKSTGKEVSLQEILIEDDPYLPVITLRLTDRNVITKLYNLENVRYIEPLDYFPSAAYKIASTSGCSASTTSLNSADYTTISPNSKLPWNFNNHTIPQAWTLSQGAGITVGVIDAGISSSQSLLGSAFNNGESNVGRTVTASYTFGSSAYTSCTHGTSMSGQAVGPRNDLGSSTGVAYKSNLNFVRGCEDVVLDKSSERTAVKNACVNLGNNNSVRIISMSIGSPFSYSVLKDGVDYANGKGKLILAAAGTSYGWTSWYGVIYPAAYSSCVAVTGVKENGSKCSSCHDGSKVQYTIVMERDANSNRNSVSLPASGTTPTYIGGSSCATATAAGIASLVWSARPNMTKEQVLTCLTNTSQFYPNKSSSKGYGNINASAAVNFAINNY